MTVEKVWIVERGCYSSSEVYAVYSTEEQAKACADLLQSLGDYASECIWYNEFDIDAMHWKGDPIWFVYWQDNRHEPLSASIDKMGDEEGYDPQDCPQIWKRKDEYGVERKDYWVMRVVARNKEHAIKIGSDLLAEAKAHYAGIA